MTEMEINRLKAKSDLFFNRQHGPIDQNEIELMYQAFKARIILELEVNGRSYDGSVHGGLNEKTIWPKHG